MAGVKRKQFPAHDEPLAVLLARGVDEALTLMSQGRISVAVDLLEGVLLRASFLDPRILDSISGDNLHAKF